jgi:predicted metal-dependent hydrolase
LRVEFNDNFKDFLDTLDTILPRPEALPYVKLAKPLGLIKIKKESLNPPVSIKEYVPGEGFYYLGRSYRLKLVENIKNESPLKLHQSRFELHRSPQSQGREHFINWYTLHLQAILDRQINNLIHRIGASPTSVKIRDLGYIFSYYGHNCDINFHWRVAMLPRCAIAYLVTHELVHLIEPNHNNAFWDRVGVDIAKLSPGAR